VNKARLAAIALSLLSATALAAGGSAAPFRLSSPVFGAGGRIPKAYTCDGAGTIVPLRWSAPPAGTRSLALLVNDPDAPVAGGFTHRLAWAISATARSLRGAAPREGASGAGRVGWVGPCPPSGTHRYVFTLYALRAPLALRAGASREAFLSALRGRVLATATLTGRYSR
jgi:Raf kinase inhibitor-like YbhB/YbcL family protein